MLIGYVEVGSGSVSILAVFSLCLLCLTASIAAFPGPEDASKVPRLLGVYDWTFWCDVLLVQHEAISFT